MQDFTTCWEGLEDPRTGNATLHDLHDLLMIALSAWKQVRVERIVT